MIAFKVEPSRMPPQYSSSSALKVMPIGPRDAGLLRVAADCEQAGAAVLRHQPDALTRLRPVTITGRFASVSTL